MNHKSGHQMTSYDFLRCSLCVSQCGNAGITCFAAGALAGVVEEMEAHFVGDVGKAELLAGVGHAKAAAGAGAAEGAGIRAESHGRAGPRKSEAVFRVDLEHGVVRSERRRRGGSEELAPRGGRDSELVPVAGQHAVDFGDGPRLAEAVGRWEFPAADTPGCQGEPGC